MNTLRVALRCLSHPATLLSLGLLIVNDHILKAAAPSWLTGKLSDFAGLFVFPFVLAAALSPLRLGLRRAGAVAAAATGLWFTLMKTAPWAASLTEAAVSQLTGFPARIVLDPTDLIALVSLWPAWSLWRRMESEAPSRTRMPGYAEWAILGVASLASLATTCLPPPAVTHVTSKDGIAYADYPYIFSQTDQPFSVFQSADGGRTWALMEAAPPEIFDQFSPDDTRTKQVCDPANAAECYRLTGGPRIEASSDGGQTWRTVWQFPQERAELMGRIVRVGVLSPCGGADSVVTTPSDLTLVNHNGQTTLIAAMGNDGVLVRAPEGTWERYAVDEARPLPYSAADASQLIWATWPEIANWIVAALLTYLSFTGWLARRQVGAEGARSARLAAWSLLGLCALGWLVWLAVVFGNVDSRLLNTSWADFLPYLVALPSLLLLIPFMIRDNPAVNIPVAVVVVVILIGLLLLAIRFLRIMRRITSQAAVRRTLGARWQTTALIFPLAYLPFVLWGVGLIPPYWLALTIACALMVAAWGYGAWRLRAQ